jgi:predicted ATP-binding protein involved in virulence
MIRAVASKNFPPFGDFRIDFPPVENKPPALAEVHVLTGVNGTGKTRLLSVLAAFLGGESPLVKRVKGTERGFHFYATDRFPAPPLGENGLPGRTPEGTTWANLFAKPDSVQRLSNRADIWFLQVPAFAYSGIAYIADDKIDVLRSVPIPTRDLALSFNRPETQSQELLQAIANVKLQATMDSLNTDSESQTESRATRLVRALEMTLTEITGLKFQLQVTTYPGTSLRVRWGGTDLSFDLLPDGLRSILGWIAHAVVMMDVWLQGKEDPMEAEAVFLLDEIESHLHPAWQRRILPAFQRLFPKSQIFIATHSPFVISSLNYGWIHPIGLTPDGKATIQPAIPASEGESYVSVLEDIMGVKEWFDPATESLLAKFRAERDAAYNGDANSQKKARDLAVEIGQRSMELDYMMGRELAQMDRQLAKAPAVQ